MRDAEWHRENRKKNPYINRLACQKYYRKNTHDVLEKQKIYKRNNPGKVLKWEKKYIQKTNVFGLSTKVFGFARSRWSKRVIKRDGKKCQVCGGKARIAHHLLFKSLYPELSLNTGNGIALCDKCHGEIHYKHAFK